MARFILLFFLAFSLALYAMYNVQNIATAVIQQLLQAFAVLVTVTGALSYALYNYIDGVLKDVLSDRNNNAHGNYRAAVASITGLKKEVLENAFAVLALLVLERLADGFAMAFPIVGAAPFNWPWACAMSVRAACFSLAVFVAFVQFRGFVVANSFRSITGRVG